MASLFLVLACLVSSILLWFAHPIAEAHDYGLGIELYAELFAIIALSVAWKTWATSRALHVLVFALGIVNIGHELLSYNAETMQHYQTAFDALAAHRNPYTAPTIYHSDALGHAAYGTFNYPPGELVPYWLGAQLAGTWNVLVFVSVQCALLLGACVVLARTFVGQARRWWPLAPWLFAILTETNSGVTLLAVALLVYAIVAMSGRRQRYALWGIFALGLLGKFFFIPLFATWHWRRLAGATRATLPRAIVDVIAPLAIVALALLPFGIVNVFDSTIGFNLALDHRAIYATYYPNPVSALCYLAGLHGIYGPLAAGLLGAAVIYSRRFVTLEAFVFVGVAFLGVATTPEPQYLPAMLFLVTSARLAEHGRIGALAE